MAGVGDVAAHRDDVRQRRERAGGLLELAGAAGVDRQAPAVGGQGAGQQDRPVEEQVDINITNCLTWAFAVWMFTPGWKKS